MHDAARGWTSRRRARGSRPKPPPWGCRASAASAVTSAGFCHTKLRSTAPHPMRSPFPLFSLARAAGATRAAPLRNPAGVPCRPSAAAAPRGHFIARRRLEKEAAQFQPGTRPHLEVPPQVVPTRAGPRVLQRANLHLWRARRRAAGVPPPPLRGTGTRPPGSVAHRTTAGVVSPPWSTLDALGRGRRASGPAMCAGEVASSPFRHRREAAAAAALRSVVKRGARRGGTA